MGVMNPKYPTALNHAKRLFSAEICAGAIVSVDQCLAPQQYEHCVLQRVVIFSFALHCDFFFSHSCMHAATGMMHPTCHPIFPIFPYEIGGCAPAVFCCFIQAV
jgi:hypothetical protein